MTDAARREREALTKRGIVWPTPRDASSIARRQHSDATTHVRKPLGLSMVTDDEPERGNSDPGRPSACHDPEAQAKEFVDMAIAQLPAEALAAPATMRDVVELGVGQALAAVFEGDDAIFDRVREVRAEVVRAHGVIRELQLERERDRASLAEMRSKLAELDFVVERLKVENRGPPGVAGPRGRDGADGARGPRGERGGMGPAGPRIIGFETDDESFTAWPLGSDGRKGATLHLRGMFESYHAQVEGEEAAEEHDADARARESIEVEAANRRAGLPAR